MATRSFLAKTASPIWAVAFPPLRQVGDGAFDLHELNGYAILPLDERKSMLAKLLKGGRHYGIALNEHLEVDGTRAFAHACALGFEGIVSKCRDSRYVSGRSKTWVKVKNPNAPRVLAVSGSGFVALAGNVVTCVVRAKARMSTRFSPPGSFGDR
jgi:ATP dependent DNA ligase domain